MNLRQRIEAVFDGHLPDQMAWYGDMELVRLVTRLVETHGRYSQQLERPEYH